MADPNTQALTMANLLVASRLPAEGDFRRNALIGAMVSQLNPLAGVLVAVRSADAITSLVRERDAARADKSGGGGSTDPPGAAALADLLRSAGGSTAASPPQVSTATPGATPTTASGDTPNAGPVSADDIRALIGAFKTGADALTKLAQEAETAVHNQEQNQAALAKVLERMGATSTETAAAGKPPAPPTGKVV